MVRIADRLRAFVKAEARQYVYVGDSKPVAYERAKPGQARDRQRYLYSYGPNAARYLALYALNNWVYTAVTRISERAAMASLQVFKTATPSELVDNHPLMKLLGRRGRPNDSQDALEFLEAHFAFVELAGNSYWLWMSRSGGQPDEVYLLNPACVSVVPGTSRRVDGYIYRVQGVEYPLPAEVVTHFKKFNPFTEQYYGMSALEALYLEIQSDRAMQEWNAEFFGEDVAIPAGILVVPTSVTPEEADRYADELNARHGERRRTAVVRADAGSTVYLPAGAAHKDLDFANGRMLSRQAVYEALDLPLGLMSAASTEAHARVAERQFYEAISRRHERLTRKLNSDATFWLDIASGLVQARFEDLSLKAADWDRESKRLAAVEQYMDYNEVRTNILNLKPKPDGDVPASVYKKRLEPKDESPARPGGQEDRGGNSVLQREGQSSDGVSADD